MEIQLTLLDGFELSLGGRSVRIPLASQRLVAFLALHDRPLLRVYVAGALWADSTEERSCANLRSALWRLPRQRSAVVEASVTHVGLAREVVVDVRALVSTARRLLDAPSDGHAADLDENRLRGDLLPDWYDEWVDAERERLRQLRAHALEALAERYVAAGRYGAAVEAALAAIRAEPLRESAHRALIGVHLAEGNHGEALRHYRAFRDRLHRELGLRPSPRIEELVRDLERPAVTMP